MVSTPLTNITQNGNIPQIGVKIKNIWNHHPDLKPTVLFFSWPQLRHFCDFRTSAWVAVPSAAWASASVWVEPGLAKHAFFIGKMVGKPLGWGPLNKSTPLIHLIYSGYLLGTISRGYQYFFLWLLWCPDHSRSLPRKGLRVPNWSLK